MSEAVRKFLLEFKQAVTSGSGVDIVPRRGTIDTLRILGLTKGNLEEILLGLSVTNYCAGPKADRDRSGEIWEFGEKLEGHDIYIKLKVANINGVNRAKCISFHVAEYPLRFPLK